MFSALSIFSLTKLDMIDLSFSLKQNTDFTRSRKYFPVLLVILCLSASIIVTVCNSIVHLMSQTCQVRFFFFFSFFSFCFFKVHDKSIDKSVMRESSIGDWDVLHNLHQQIGTIFELLYKVREQSFCDDDCNLHLHFVHSLQFSKQYDKQHAFHHAFHIESHNSTFY